MNALRKLPNVDMYLTGSNSAILSGDLATRLSGRYVTINMLPLSFKEYVSAYPFKNRTTEEKFSDYIHNGGFPYSMRMTISNEERENWDLGGIRMLNSGIWNTIIMKDLIERKKIREVERLNNKCPGLAVRGRLQINKELYNFLCIRQLKPLIGKTLFSHF